MQAHTGSKIGVGDMSLFGVVAQIGHVGVHFSRFNMCNRPFESVILLPF
jgi:hypothetical protein